MEERLLYLESGEVIDCETKEYGLQTFRKLCKNYDCEDKIETFITHIVMAISRIKKGEIMQCDFEEMIQDIESEVGKEQLDFSIEVAKSLIETSPVEFPKEEFVFLLMHLNAMMVA